MANNRLVWFLLVDGEGHPFRGTTASSVFVPSEYVIDQFRDAVKEKYKDSHLKGIAPSDLVVYANKAAFDRKDDPLQPQADIGDYGTKESQLYVVVPATKEDRTPNETDSLLGRQTKTCPEKCLDSAYVCRLFFSM